MSETSRLVIEVDSSGFIKAEGNAKVFESVLNKIQGTATKTESSVKGLGDNFAAFNLVINKLPGPLKSLTSGLTGMVSPATAAVSAVIELTEAAVNFGRESLQAFSDFEMIRANLEIVTGSAQEASVTFGQLREMAGRTPFDVEGLANAAVQLRQTGTSARELIPTLTLLGNVAGGSSEKFNRIVANYAQINSVTKATSMDLKQFAMMGIPIYDVLQKLGVTGTATARDIQNAFQLMAGEGGQFFNAMTKGAETLAGKTTNLEGVWKTFKATFAEVTGLDELWKGILDDATAALNDLARAMTEESWYDFSKRAESGMVTVSEKLRYLTGQVDYFNWLLYEDEYAETATEEYLQNLRDQLAEYEKQLEVVSRMNELLEERTAAEERWKEAVEKSGKEYLNVQSKIGEEYAKTGRGREEQLLAEIAYWEKQLTATYITEKEMPWSNGLKIAQTIGLSEEEKAKIAAILQTLQEQLEKGRGKAESELELWQKILINHTGFTIEQMEKMWAGLSSGKSLPVIEQFEKVMNMRGDVQLGLFGNDIDNQIRIAEEAANVYRKLYEDMFTVTLDKDGNIITVWTESEAAAQEAKKAWEDAEQVLGSAKFDNYIQGLDRELLYLQMGNEEREKAVFLDDLKKQGLPVYDEQGNPTESGAAAWEHHRRNQEQSGLNRENDYLDTLRKELDLERQLADSEISREEYAIRKLEIEQQISEAAAQEAGAMIRATEEAAKITEKRERGEETVSSLQEQLDLEQQLASGEISREEYAIRKLEIEQDISYEHAKQVYELEKQIETYEVLKDIVSQIGQTSLSSLIEMSRELGEAFRDGADFSDAMDAALKNMVRRVIDSLPQLFLSAGLQMIMAGNWAAGLALIAASGLSAFVSGLIGDSSDGDESSRQLEELKKLQDEVTKLIDQQKEQAEYYLRKRQELNADAAIGNYYNVNDMILTPHGTFSTHPDDYIIATKHPEDMVKGNMQVNVKVVNNADTTVTATSGIGIDGLPELLVMIDQRVQGNIASGKYENAFSARGRKISGRNLST